MKEKKSKNKKITELCIVKRKGHCEVYDEKKVYASCYFACRSCHLTEKESEEMCSKICKTTNKWIKGRREISSNDIFKFLTKELKKCNEDAAFMYEAHKDIS